MRRSGLAFTVRASVPIRVNMGERPPIIGAVAVALAVLAGGCALDLFATGEGQELDAAASSLVPEGNRGQ